MQFLILILFGVGMGMADLVPGISGGTVAFILGIYEELIAAIKNPFRSFKFLIPLLSGIGIALITLSRAVHHLLADPGSRQLLFAAFVGLVLGSLYFVARRIPQWKWGHYLTFVIGAVIAYFLSGPSFFSQAEIDTVSSQRVFFSGMIAVSAMLLPGISGSYLLVIMGLYQTVMAALVQFVDGLSKMSLDSQAFQFLLLLGSGIIAGAVLFSRVISWLLNHYHNRTIALLCGFMFGALRAVWPFETGVPEVQLQTLLLLGVSLLGFFIVFGIELIALRRK